jgi:hypothetical protein
MAVGQDLLSLLEEEEKPKKVLAPDFLKALEEEERPEPIKPIDREEIPAPTPPPAISEPPGPEPPQLGELLAAADRVEVPPKPDVPVPTKDEATDTFVGRVFRSALEVPKRQIEALKKLPPVESLAEARQQEIESGIKRFWWKKPDEKLNVVDKLRDVFENPAQVVPFRSGIDATSQMERLLEAGRNLDADRATPEDIELLKGYVKANEHDKTFGFKVAEIVAALPAFAGELGLTAGAFIGAKQAAEKAGMAALRKVITQTGKKTLLAKSAELGVKIAAGVTGATAQTVPAGIARIEADTLRRMLPQISTVPEEQSEAEIAIVGKGEDVVPALLKAVGNQWVETVSERSGGLFRKMLAPVNKGLGNLAVKAGLAKAFQKANPGKSLNRFRQLVQRVGYDGIIEEMLEERLGEVGRAALGIEDYNFPELDQLAAELVAFSIPGAAIGLTAKAIEKKEEVKPGIPEEKIEPPIPAVEEVTPEIPTKKEAVEDAERIRAEAEIPGKEERIRARADEEIRVRDAEKDRLEAITPEAEERLKEVPRVEPTEKILEVTEEEKAKTEAELRADIKKEQEAEVLRVEDEKRTVKEPLTVKEKARAEVEKKQAEIKAEISNISKKLGLVRRKVTEKGEITHFDAAEDVAGPLSELINERARLSVDLKKAKGVELNQIKTSIIAYAQKVGLRGEKFAGVDTLVKRAKSINGLNRALDIIDKRMAVRAKRKILAKTIKLIRKEKKRIRGIEGKKQPTIALTQNRKIKEYIERYSLKPEAKTEKLKKSFEFFENNPDEEMPSALKRDIVDVFRTNLRMMDANQLNQIIDDINTLKKQGKLKREIIEEQKQRAREEDAQKLQTQLRKAKNVRSALSKATQKQSRWQRTKEFATDFGWSHIRPERIVEWFTNFKPSVLKKQVYDKTLNAERTKLKNMEQSAKEFEENNKNIDIAETNKVYMDLIESSLDEKGNVVDTKIPITIDQGMFIYANSQNDGNLAHLLGTGLNEYMIMEAITNLDQKYKDAVDKQIDYYDEVQYPRVSKVFAEEHQIDLPKEDRYFPIKNLQTNRAENEIMADLIARFSARNATTQKGFTRTRVKSKAAFKSMSYYKNVISNMQDTNHYIAYNTAVKDISAFLRMPEVREPLENISEKAYKEILDWQKDVGLGRIRRSDLMLDKISDYLRRNFVPAVLGFNLVTMAKQPASFAQGLERLDKKANGAASAAEFFSNPLKMIRFVDDLSVIQKHRSKTFERELAEIAESAAYKKATKGQNILDKIKELSMFGIQAADKATTTILWNARFKEVFNKTANQEQAINAADELIRKTQPAGAIIDLPKLYRAGGIARAFTMFTNQLNQNANLMFEMADTWGIQKTSKNLARVFFYMVAPAIIIYLASNAFSPKKLLEDPEGLAQAFLSNMVGGVMLINTLSNSMAAKLANFIRQARGGMPKRIFLNNMAPASFQIFADIERAMVAPRLTTKIDRGLQAYAKFKGIPISQFRRTVKGVPEFLKTKDIRHLIWSKQAIEIPSVENAMIKRLQGRNKEERRRARDWINSQSAEKQKEIRAKIRKGKQ